MSTEILKSLTQILNDVEESHGCSATEHIINHAVQTMLYKTYPTSP